jgi:hypothetical protein
MLSHEGVSDAVEHGQGSPAATPDGYGLSGTRAATHEKVVVSQHELISLIMAAYKMIERSRISIANLDKLLAKPESSRE